VFGIGCGLYGLLVAATLSSVCDPPVWDFLILGDFSACGAGNNGQTALDRKDQATASSLETGIAIPVGAKTTGPLRKNAMLAEFGGTNPRITTSGTITRKGRKHIGTRGHRAG